MEKIETRTVRLSEVQLNSGQIEGVPKNPRFIRSGKYRKLLASIKEDPEMLELRELIVYDNNGSPVVVGGNMRYRALQELGYTEAVCKVLPRDFPKEKLRRIILKDNASYGETDWDALLSDWEMPEIEAAAIDVPDLPKPKAEEQAEDDGFKAAEKIPEEATAREGDLYRLGEHLLFVADGWQMDDFGYILRALMRRDDMADMMVCDMTGIGELRGINVFIRSVMRVVRDGAACYVWYDDKYRLDIESQFSINRMRIGQTLVWVKRLELGGKKDYNAAHATCLYGWKKEQMSKGEGEGNHYFCNKKHLSDVLGDRQAEDFAALPKSELVAMLQALADGAKPDVMKVDFDARNTVANAKPIAIAGEFIANSSRTGDAILDLSCDAGETLIAAQQLGRRCRTVARVPKIADVIISRWEEYTGGKAELLHNINDKEEKRV